jgi:hypothetical protein
MFALIDTYACMRYNIWKRAVFCVNQYLGILSFSYRMIISIKVKAGGTYVH